jgi:hypothetical protein
VEGLRANSLSETHVLKRPSIVINILTALCLSHVAALDSLGAQRPAVQQEKKLDEKIEPRRPGKTDDELVAEAFAASIREALRKPAEGETRVVGLFTRVDCGARGGVVFNVKVGKRLLKLNREGFDGLHLMAFTPDAAGRELVCGPRKPLAHVVATYRPAASGPGVKTDGALVALEFVPADFKLK